MARSLSVVLRDAQSQGKQRLSSFRYVSGLYRFYGESVSRGAAKTMGNAVAGGHITAIQHEDQLAAQARFMLALTEELAGEALDANS